MWLEARDDGTADADGEHHAGDLMAWVVTEAPATISVAAGARTTWAASEEPATTSAMAGDLVGWVATEVLATTLDGAALPTASAAFAAGEEMVAARFANSRMEATRN